MICPNCGFTSAPGTMFCGKCGTRLSPAPAQSNSYAPQPQPTVPSQPYGGYSAPQRTYTPTPPPAEISANPYAVQPPVARPSYGSPMMQSPYITGASRSSAPVLSSSRDGAAQYTAVSTNVYSPQARAAAVANEQATRKKKTGSVIMTVISVLLIAAMAGIIWFSGIFEPEDNGIVIPENSGTESTTQSTAHEPEIITPPTSDSDAVSGSDISEITSATDTADNGNVISNSVPAGLTRAQLTEINSFISAFTETGTTNIDGAVSSKELVSFAVSGLAMNSTVYTSESFANDGNNYNYSVSESFVNQRISRYFGENVKIYPAIGDSGDGWLYYGSKYYFAEIPKSAGFAVVTNYSASGELAAVSFNVYASAGNDSDYYSMTAGEVENAGGMLVGNGTAVVGKTSYNGRDTYILQSISFNVR